MALQGYEGALVVISHDRHLLRNTVDQFYLVADGQVQEFDGDLKDYQNWLKNFSRLEAIEAPKVEEILIDKKVSRQQSADERKKLAPLTKKIKMLEAGLEKLQKQLTLVEAQLAETDIYNDDQKYQLKKSLSDQADIKRNIGAIEEDWLQCQDSLENTWEPSTTKWWLKIRAS